MSSVLRRNIIGGLCILQLLWAPAPIGAVRAAACPSSAASVGGRVDPSACVAYGTQFALQLNEFAPGQVRSLVLRWPGGLISGADRSLRVDRTGRLLLDTTSYFGTHLGSGSYTVWVKDPTGAYPPARLDFAVHGGDHLPTATTQPTRTPRPTATRSPAPTSAVVQTSLPSSPAGTAAPAIPSATATVSATARPGARPTATPPTATTRASPTPTVTPTVSQTALPPAARGERVRILVVDPDWSDDEELVEYVVLQNVSDEPIALVGWSLGDDDGNRIQLPARTAAGGSLLWIWTGVGVDDDANVYLGHSAAMWDLERDVAVLLNAAGQEEARFAY